MSDDTTTIVARVCFEFVDPFLGCDRAVVHEHSHSGRFRDAEAPVFKSRLPDSRSQGHSTEGPHRGRHLIRDAQALAAACLVRIRVRLDQFLYNLKTPKALTVRNQLDDEPRPLGRQVEDRLGVTFSMRSMSGHDAALTL